MKHLPLLALALLISFPASASICTMEIPAILELINMPLVFAHDHGISLDTEREKDYPRIIMVTLLALGVAAALGLGKDNPFKKR